MFDPAAFKEEELLIHVDPLVALPFGMERIACRTVAYMIDVHQDLGSRLRIAQFFDDVYVAQQGYVEAFRSAGHPRASWLPLACDPEIHCARPQERTLELGFVGNMGLRNSKRHQILASVLPKFRTNDYLRYHSPREMATVYGRSKIVLNASINGDVNMRVFEAMAAGALLVTDRIGNGLADLFEEGIHFVAYEGPDDARRKIDHYLEHGEEREKIACAGQELVLERHTYSRRLDTILEGCSHPTLGAPARHMSAAALGPLYSDVLVSLRQPGRFPGLIKRYGLGRRVAIGWSKALGRTVNARVPLTPRAIRAHLNR